MSRWPSNAALGAPSLLAAFLAGSLVAGGAGCNTAVQDVDAPDAGSPSCREAKEHSDLEWLQANVFTPSCSRFTACHKGRASMAAHLSLEDGKTYDELIGVEVEAEEFPGLKRVVPGDPETSYLMIVLGHYGPIDTESGTMPLNNPLLCMEKREAIERWILAGAPETAHDGGPDAAPAPDAGVDAGAVATDASDDDATTGDDAATTDDD